MRAFLLTALLLASTAAAQSPEGGADDTGTPALLDVEKLPFTPDSIRMVVSESQPKIQRCYEDMLSDTRKVEEGRVATSFIITAEGLVKRARVVPKGTTLRNRKLHACIVAVLTSLSFPKPPDGREYPIDYPFNLKAIR